MPKIDRVALPRNRPAKPVAASRRRVTRLEFVTLVKARPICFTPSSHPYASPPSSTSRRALHLPLDLGHSTGGDLSSGPNLTAAGALTSPVELGAHHLRKDLVQWNLQTVSQTSSALPAADRVSLRLMSLLKRPNVPKTPFTARFPSATDPDARAFFEI